MSGLKTVSTSDLERLLTVVRKGKLPLPPTKPILASMQLGHLADRLGALTGLDAGGAAAVLEAVIAEREGGVAVKAELVWTGPEGKAGWAAPTSRVLSDLFARARRSMLVAGYSFDHGAEILEPIHEAMASRGVTVDLFMNIGAARADETDPEQFARGEVSKFLVEQWPWQPKPNVYYDPRTVTPAAGERKPGRRRPALEYASLHAKCVVADERWSLVGSANFTDRAQTRNIEVGALLDDPSFAQALLGQFRGAVAAGVFVHWLG